ncbi:mitochondrial amidoxime reducing component 2-like [Palaemon carinicauda]|uniref:mitochondrial amidoxime reducing component 2-like n=1 Tax=Palaemon carinicauda TaxID=392227 RepID=UPI0035B61D11
MFLQQTVDQKSTIFTVFVAGIVALSAYIYWMGRKKSRQQLPMKPQFKTLEELQKVEWEHVGKVSKIWIYPVKSCAGVPLKKGQTGPLGLMDGKVRDRSLAFTTEKGSLIRGSMIGATVKINPIINGNSLTLKYPDVEDLTVDLEQVENNKKEATINIFGDIAPGLDCGESASGWLEKVLGKKAHLLYHSDIPSPRTTDSFVGKFPLTKKNDNSLYADCFPYLLMTKESVIDLQSRVSCPAPAENFRPNILIEGVSKAYDEDNWAYVKIGSAIFRNVFPCTRCTFTTVNYETGIKENDMEPLRTLKKYRCLLEGESSPCFGIHLAVELQGTITDGDDVYVTRLLKE